MSRLDDVIVDVAYVLDTLRAYRDITKTGSCNTCTAQKNCKHRPAWGEMVRYNCPHYEGGTDD